MYCSVCNVAIDAGAAGIGTIDVHDLNIDTKSLQWHWNYNSWAAATG